MLSKVLSNNSLPCYRKIGGKHMSFSKNLFSNTKKPQGLMGKMMVNSMNKGHANVSDWGMSKLPAKAYQTIADLGCGGGRNVQELLKKHPQANVTAVDYSEISVNKTTKLNADAISNGRLAVLQADVSNLSLPSNAYDLVTAFETIYFWPGPKQSFEEVYRILKPNSYFLIVNEADGLNEKDNKWVEIIDGMCIYQMDELKNYLTKVGFREVTIFHEKSKHWAAFLAKK